MDSILGRIAATVLGLLLLAAVGLGIYRAFSGNKVSQMTTDVALLQTNARAQFSQGGNGYANFKVNAGAPAAGLLATDGTSAVIPADMISGGVVHDAWGNPVTIAPAGTGNSSFTLSFGGANMTASQCTQLATSLNGYQSLTIGATTFTPSNQPDSVTAGAACQNTGESVAIQMM